MTEHKGPIPVQEDLLQELEKTPRHKARSRIVEDIAADTDESVAISQRMVPLNPANDRWITFNQIGVDAAFWREFGKGRIDGCVTQISRRIGADQAKFQREISQCMGADRQESRMEEQRICKQEFTKLFIPPPAAAGAYNNIAVTCDGETDSVAA